MVKLISLGTINKSLLFLIIMSISSVLNKYIYGFTYIECFYPINIYRSLYNWIIDKDKTDFPRHRVFDPLFSYIGIIFLTLLFVKDKDKDKDKNKEVNSSKIKIDRLSSIIFILKKEREYLKDFKGLSFYILIIVLWIAEENLLLIYVDIFQDLDFWFFELIFVSIIFSKVFIFKISLHQKLGMAISIIVGSLLKIYSISLSLDPSSNNFYSKNKGLIAFVILYFILIILRSYVNTQLKVFFDIKYISQRILLISYGIIGTIMCTLIGIFTSTVPCSENLRTYVCNMEYDGKLYYDNFLNYYESWKNMLVRLIVIFLGIITYFPTVFYCTMIIKYFTPIHVIFSFPIQFFIEKTFLLILSAIFFRENLFKGDNLTQKFLLDESGDIASIIGFLIYLEIIELNFCGLNYNLKKNIIIRSESDVNGLFISDYDSDSDSEDDNNDHDIVELNNNESKLISNNN